MYQKYAQLYGLFYEYIGTVASTETLQSDKYDRFYIGADSEVFEMMFSEAYPMLVAKAECKGRTNAEVDEVMSKSIEELLETEYWVIDILPSQVPEDSPGQYFAVEKYFLQDERMAAIKQKHINIVLKLNCYRDIALDEEKENNPPPEHVAEEMRKRFLYILTGDSMIQSEPDDTCLTVYNPDSELLEMLKEIASGEGLFVWKPQGNGDRHDISV